MSLTSALLSYHVLKSSNLQNEKQQLARATLTDLTYKNIKKQLIKAIEDNSSIQSENSFQIKSATYLAKTKNEHPALHSNNWDKWTCSNWGKLIIIARVVIIIAVGVLGRVNPLSEIMEQINQRQSMGINGDIKLIL